MTNCSQIVQALCAAFDKTKSPEESVAAVLQVLLEKLTYHPIVDLDAHGTELVIDANDVEFVIRELRLRQMLAGAPEPVRLSVSAFRLWMPYCLKKATDDIGGWLVLNRYYKPIGRPQKPSVDYGTVDKSLRIKKITEKQQKRLAHGKSSGGLVTNESVFLYEDGSVPTACAKAWDAYSERLALLAKLKCFGS